MAPWPANPLIYEINTWVWLGELGRRHGAPLCLDTVPGAEWDAIAAMGFDAVWLMGVWERSPAGIAIANRNQGLLDDFRRALPDFSTEDNVGSPYCVRRYRVDARLGGNKGLAVARSELAQRGMRLVLDFVPNHVAPDHPWVSEHPQYFIQGSADDLRSDPSLFVSLDGVVLACGRDPFFPAWPDVVQPNAFLPEVRLAVVDVLKRIAGLCDGVRCDMAMLLMNPVFERTWGWRAGSRPEAEYWVEVIPAVKRAHADFLFIAEAYWDLEWDLQQQGFDYCYDKRLYDRLEHETAESVRLHLCADPGYQSKLVRFIENHDEPRAAESMHGAKNRAAAVVIATIPGARLFHEGQFEGATVRVPVFLGRRPVESVDSGLRDFHRRLMDVASLNLLHDGQWQLCDRTGWSDNRSFENLVAWCWCGHDDRLVVVVNLSASAAQGLVRVPWDELKGTDWQLADILTGESYVRSGDGLLTEGLYVDLGPWGHHVLGRWKPV